jgi:hypothetical protein
MQKWGILVKIAAGLVSLSAALGAALAPAAAKELVVTASTGATLKVGQVIDGDAVLSLPGGASVALIGADGKSIALKGPYNGKPGQGGGDDRALVSKLAQLLGTRQAEADSVGAVRGGNSHAAPSQAWVVDVEASGTVCVPSGAAPVLWRGDAANPMHMTLRRASGEGSASVSWSEGAATMPWPSDLPVVDQEKYLIRRPNRSLPNVVLLRQVPANLTNDARRAVWMDENGCQDQALRLLTARP